MIRENRYQIEGFGETHSRQNLSDFFSIMLSFNLQIYSIDIRNEMQNPTQKRVGLLTKISNLIVFFVNITISLISYLALGKNELNEILYKYALN